MTLLCPWESARYFFFSSEVPSLLYYSHLFAILAAIIFALALLPRFRESLAVKLFFVTISFFTVWTILDIPLWALNHPNATLFIWSIEALLVMFLYTSAFYLAYVFVVQKDLGFLWKVGLIILVAPILALLPTTYLFPSVDISQCIVSETPFAIFFTFGVKALFILGIVITSFWGAYTKPERRSEIMLFMTGILIFLVAFSSGNVIGSITGDWSLSQVGLFGMPIFIAFLAYTVVKFKTFNMKFFATQALVVGTAILIGSQILASSSVLNLCIASATLVIFLISGMFLIRSVRREIEQREHIEQLAKELEETNERQEGLLHFIGHEVKGFLTKDSGVFAELSEGDFGVLPETMKPLVDHALEESRRGVDSVSNILKASNLKKGAVAYNKESFDLKALVAEAVERAKPTAQQKGLALSFVTDDSSYQMTGDKVQINDHILRNLIDNSINYTPSGSVEVSLKKENPSAELGAGGKFIFAVKDTGIGITEEDGQHLFTEGGHGKDSQKVNAHSTGYGLYIAKQITLAHNGTIRAESAGEGKGSAFIVEFPADS